VITRLSKESDEISYLAWLSRIALNDDTRRRIAERMSAVRKIVDKLLQANVEGIEPLYHPQEGQAGFLRKDEPSKRDFDLNTALEDAARTEEGFIVAPRTVEE
jgi:aspartyl-tRNA(Asn)/glutamyl-tRNA(Gln) amidotransferase subunit C